MKIYLQDRVLKNLLIQKGLHSSRTKKKDNAIGRVILFGSGEMSPTGRRIHETVMKSQGLKAPVRIGILETPTGFEVNARHGWPERMEAFLLKGLSNFSPIISRIRAWRKDGDQSTNTPSIVDVLLKQDYIYCGAGSPGYTVTHLQGSRAYDHLVRAHAHGTVLCLGSATAVAISAFALPVYEIFKVGEDLHWKKGLDFFGQYGLRLAIIPHWNNTEGQDFDTTYCWMGKSRFDALYAMLPPDVIVLGIDEQTACIFDIQKREITVQGIGCVHIIKQGKTQTHKSGVSFSFAEVE